MNSEFWIQKWENGETRFHQTHFHPIIEKFGDRFREGTVLVPLCGKSLDMIWLANKGHKVIGVELSPIACRDFFSENKIPFSEKKINGFDVYNSDQISLWCGDFFNLPQVVWDLTTGIYDRAALVALSSSVRRRYAEEITQRTTKKVEILLISFEYPEDKVQGPPFSIREEEIRENYKQFEVQKIFSEKELRYTKDHPKLKSIDLNETAYWLKKL